MIDSPRAWRWVLRVAAFATIAPLFVTRHLPFCDVPEHLAAIATLRHWLDPEWGSRASFTLAAGNSQYLLYYVAGALLAVPLGSAERANLLLLACVGLAYPYSLRALLRALKRDERWAILGCALFWSPTLSTGLVNYVAAVPLTIYAFALVAEQASAPTTRRALGLAAIALAIFFLHLSAFLLFGAGAFVLAWSLPGHGGGAWRALPRRLAWMAPVGIVALAWAATSDTTHPEASQGPQAGVVRFTRTADLIRALPNWMHDVFRTRLDDVAGAAIWIALAVLVVARARDRDRDPTRVPGALLFATSLALYFAAPSQVGFAFLLDLRYAVFVGLLAAVALPAARGKTGRAALAIATCASLVIAGDAAWQLHRVEVDETGPFDELLRQLPRGKRLLSLIFDPDSARLNVPPFLHFGAYYRARYGGVASFSFTELPHWPIRYRPEAAPPRKASVFWDWNPCLYRNTYDGPYYDFVLTRGALEPFSYDPPGPHWEQIGGARSWRLWAKTDAGREGIDDLGPCVRGRPR